MRKGPAADRCLAAQAYDQCYRERVQFTARGHDGAGIRRCRFAAAGQDTMTAAIGSPAQLAISTTPSLHANTSRCEAHVSLVFQIQAAATPREEEPGLVQHAYSGPREASVSIQSTSCTLPDRPVPIKASAFALLDRPNPDCLLVTRARVMRGTEPPADTSTDRQPPIPRNSSPEASSLPAAVCTAVRPAGPDVPFAACRLNQSEINSVLRNSAADDGINKATRTTEPAVPAIRRGPHGVPRPRGRLRPCGASTLAQ